MKNCTNIKQAIHIAVLSIVLALANQPIFAQQAAGQQDAIGIRLGTDPGITYKHYFANNGGIELMLHTGYRGLLFTGLYEWHLPFPSAPGLYGVLGVGGHIGVWDRVLVYRRKGPPGRIERIYVYPGSPSLGVDGLFGIEYRFAGAPVNLGFDLKPSIDIYRAHPYGLIDAALSVRFRI